MTASLRDDSDRGLASCQAGKQARPEKATARTLTQPRSLTLPCSQHEHVVDAVPPAARSSGSPKRRPFDATPSHSFGIAHSSHRPDFELSIRRPPASAASPRDTREVFLLIALTGELRMYWASLRRVCTIGRRLERWSGGADGRRRVRRPPQHSLLLGPRRRRQDAAVGRPRPSCRCLRRRLPETVCCAARGRCCCNSPRVALLLLRTKSLP